MMYFQSLPKSLLRGVNGSVAFTGGVNISRVLPSSRLSLERAKEILKKLANTRVQIGPKAHTVLKTWGLMIRLTL
jgi:hypothetical protein